jgi:ABC-type dipeptide/oligopeptide/nickel transport system permease component
MRRSDYLIKRTGFALATIFVAITLNFFLFRVLPGSAVTNIAHVPHASLQLQESLKRQFGLDRPVAVQYLLYLKQLAHGNLGVSWADQQPVKTHLATNLANTVPMLALGTLVAMVAGITTGVLAAWRRGRAADYGHTGVALLFYSFPTQWLGLMLLILLASYLPAGGMSDPFLIGAGFWQRVADTTRHMLLPSLTVALTCTAATR